MLKDILGQAWEAMVYNRRRTTITIVGMAWGIATVVLLLAYGAGFSHAIEAIFAQWGTTLIGTFPGRTSEQAGGDKAESAGAIYPGRCRHNLANGVPGLVHITPTVNKDVPVQDDLHTYTWTVNGVLPVAEEVMHLPVETGRFFNGAEESERAHVAVIGPESKTKLFSGQYPIGQSIRINGIRFTVVGVLESKMQEGDNDSNRQVYIPFSTMSDIKDTKYLDGIWLNYVGNYELVEKNLRATLAAAHHFRLLRSSRHLRCQSNGAVEPVPHSLDCPAGAAGDGGRADAGHRGHRPDEHHVRGRAAAHARDRHRKALGAQKRHILTQFLAEAFVITGVGGALGIVLAEVVSVGVGRITFYSAIAASHAEDADIYLRISPASVRRSHRHSDCNRAGERDDSSNSRGQSRSNRGPAVRITAMPGLEARCKPVWSCR